MTETIERPATKETTTKTWMNVAFAGAVAMVAWSILLQAIAGFIPPVAVIGLIFAIFAVFLHGDRPRLGLVVAIVAIVAVFGNLPIILDDLSNPGSAPSFILNSDVTDRGGPDSDRRLRRLPGVPDRSDQPCGEGRAGGVCHRRALLDAGGSQHRVRPGSDRRRRLGRRRCGLGAGGDHGRAPGMESGSTTEMGSVTRFTIEDEGVDLEIVGLKSSRIDLDLEPGSYQFVCAVPGHESMVGTLTVSS